jgi:large subunit ribosomal protein L10
LNAADPIPHGHLELERATARAFVEPRVRSLGFAREMFGVGMDRSQKADLVEALKSVFAETSVVVVTRNLGLTVAQSTDLRLKMRDAGAQFKVTKNSLALIALQGSQYSPLGELLTGPTALATSGDPVAAAKVAVDFAKTTDRFEIVGGAMGNTMLDVNGIKALAALPSLNELRAKLVATFAAPATQFVRTLAEPGTSFVRVLQARVDQQQAA